MRYLIGLILGVFLCFGTTLALAGSLDSPAAPTSPDSAMYTLEDIYNRLNDGSAGSKRSGAFTPPSAGPTVGTGYTLDEVMGKAPSVDDTNGAGVANVLADKTFWGLTSGAWGIKTGTMPDREGDNASTARAQSEGVNYFIAPEGYYDGDDRVSATDAQVAALDTDLTQGNIKKDVEIFGITGTYPLAEPGSTGQTPTVPFAAPTGSDGDLQKGAPWPDPRFTDNTGSETGTVTDNLTGLMWAKDANTPDEARTWSNALADCNGLTLGGHSDWRLPNVKELLSLIDWSQRNPALPSVNPFSNVQTAYYWSSTTSAEDTGDAWYVSMTSGYVNDSSKTDVFNQRYVWPVRGGQ